MIRLAAALLCVFLPLSAAAQDTLVVRAHWGRRAEVALPKSATSETLEEAASHVVGAHGMTVWAIEYGPLDEQCVVRYRIVPSP